MIYLFHGEDQLQSRQAFYTILKKLKTTPPQTLKLFYPKIDSNQIDNFINTSSLFTEKKILLLHGFFSLSTPKLEPVLKLINQDPNLDTLLWESKTIPPGKIKKLKNPRLSHFAIPQTIFRFLDSLKPQNPSVALNLFHSTLKIQAPELIHYFLKDHLRLLIMAQEKEFTKVNKFPSWRQSKLISQSRLFRPDQLKNFYNHLVDLEYRQKTGQLDSTLDFHLTLFIISLSS
jgi:DNA polymerase III delta subunit